MSSADIASTTPIDSRLICRPLSRDPRMPVTTISCSVLALCDVGRPVVCGAWAGSAAAAAGVFCATRPAPLAGSVPLEASRVTLERSDLACWAVGAVFDFLALALAALAGDASCACTPLAKAMEPSARLDRPRLDRLRVLQGRRSALMRSARAFFEMFRLDLRLIRNLPLERN